MICDRNLKDNTILFFISEELLLAIVKLINHIGRMTILVSIKI